MHNYSWVKLIKKNKSCRWSPFMKWFSWYATHMDGNSHQFFRFSIQIRLKAWLFNWTEDSKYLNDFLSDFFGNFRWIGCTRLKPAEEFGARILIFSSLLYMSYKSFYVATRDLTIICVLEQESQLSLLSVLGIFWIFSFFSLFIDGSLWAGWWMWIICLDT